jgi:hypothetical protein
MLALGLWESGLCRRCGHHLSETTDPDNDQDNPDARHGWQADGPDECHACKALHRAEEKWAKTSPEVAPYSIWSAVTGTRSPSFSHERWRRRRG